MASVIGWILDTYVEGDEVVIWLRTVEDQVIKLTDRYQPSFYILPKSIERGKRLLSLLERQPGVIDIGWEERYVNLRDRQRRSVLCLHLEGTSAYKQFVRSLETSEYVQELFDTDLLHIQQYLFTKLQVEPTSKVQTTFNEDGELINVNRIDDDKEIAPPPFTALCFEIHISASVLNPDPYRDRIGSIEVRFQNEEEFLEGDEQQIIQKFSDIVQSKDPDLLISPHCDEFTFPYLFTRSKLLVLNPQFGREKIDINRVGKPLPYWIRGRIAVDYNLFGCTFEDWGIAGLVERARFSFMPPSIAARWTSNRVNESRVCYELMKKGYVIPKNTGYYEYVRPIEEIVARDRGAMIISPKIGLHPDVGELDFESEYPHIIVKDCISYETVTPHGLRRSKNAVLPFVTKRCLDRRLYYKRLRKSLPKDSKEWLWCEQRQSSLKLILVTLYGTSGCCWNRFGNVLAFEEINRKSREIMLKTKDFVQQRGFEIVYADCDSVFSKKPGATKEDYEKLAKEIGEYIGLPIALDHHYKFLLLLPIEADPSGNMEAQKHYFGLLYNGEVLARGIELRRHDTPKFIKDFQIKLIKTLFDCENTEQVQTTSYEKALQVVTEAIDGVTNGEVPTENLVISKILRKPASQYRSIVPHVSAAIQLAVRGKVVNPGETVDFIYTDADHHNPLCRVIAYDFTAGRVNPDKEKYRDMVLDAAETVLSIFGFSREIYGLKRTDKRWWQEFRNEQRK